MRVNWWLFAAVVAVGMALGCASASRQVQLAPAPYVVGPGMIRDVVVRPGVAGSREISQRLIAELCVQPLPVCLTVRVVTPDGQVMARATVFGEHPDRQLHFVVADARALLVGCLAGIHNWETPTLIISLPGFDAPVLAGATFTRPQENPVVEHLYERDVCLVRHEPPLHVAVSGLSVSDAERLIEYGQAYYPHPLRSDNLRLEISGR